MIQDTSYDTIVIMQLIIPKIQDKKLQLSYHHRRMDNMQVSSAIP